MKRKFAYHLVLLILITSSCNTFNNGNLFSSRQGKNKVIDRDFEAQDDFEETNQIAETETYQDPENTIETPTESIEEESNTENTIEPTPSAFNIEGNSLETFEKLDNNLSNETTVEEYEPIESQDVAQVNDDNSDPDTAAKVALIVILVIVGLVALFFLLILLFILSLF
jgi:cell division protein FtsX